MPHQTTTKQYQPQYFRHPITFHTTMDTKTAFRIQGIPQEWTFEDLHSAITQLCDQREAEALSVIGRLTPAAEPDIHSQVAVLQFNSQLPEILKSVLGDATGQTTLCRELEDGSTLVFDKNFWGMTLLHEPESEDEVTME